MNDILLNYRVLGNGHPVLFLHGFLESISMWKVLELDTLPFQSVLIDLPGHGKSLNEDDREPSIDFMSEKVIEVIRELGITEFSVVGHSMGGYIALNLKKRFSTKDEKITCEKVVLLNSNFWEDSESKKKDRLRVADIVFKNKNLFVKEAIPNLFVDKEVFKKEIENLLSEALLIDKHAISYASLAMRNRPDTKEVITQNPNDFLIIQGLLDPIVQANTMKEEVKGLNVIMEILDDAGHMAHFESTRNVQKIISGFL
jgi:pimeloyl-ACP methyl ester carboxylesterase